MANIKINPSSTQKLAVVPLSFVSLAPSSLTAKKGVRIIHTDNLRYSRGSLQGGDGSGVVYENFDPNQGTLEFWVRPNWNGGDNLQHHIFDACSDANNQVQLYKNTSNNLILEVKGVGTSQTVSQSISAWTAGTWYHLVAVWDKNNDVNSTNNLYVYINGSGAGSTTAPTALASLPSTFFIGADYNIANQFNGIIAGRILNRPLTSTEVSTNYASGAGHTDTFTVTPDTVWLGTYFDSDDDTIFQHRGQQVTAITDTATESALTLGQAVGSRSWKDNDRVVVWDGTSWKKEGLIDEASIATTDTSLDVDDGAGAVVTDLSKVGVYATLNGTTQYFSKTDNASLSITGDLTIQGWIKTSSATTNTVVSKWDNTNNKRSYWLYIAGSGVLGLYVSDDGTNSEVKTGAIVVNNGKWHFVAAVFDNKGGVGQPTVDFYVDGYLDRQQTFTTETGTLHDNDSELRIGAIGGTAANFFNGSLRNIQIFNDKRTTTEILTDTTNPMTDNSGNANNVSQWLMTDASTVTTLDDLNANANDLTLNGGTTTNYGTHSRTQQAFISKNLIADGGMEQGGIGAWSPTNATIAKNTSVVKFDTRSLSVTNTGAAQGYARQTITTAAGEDYRFHGWFYAPTTPNEVSQLVDVDGTAALGITVTQAGATTAATWYEIDFTFEAADTSTTIDLGSGSATNAEIGYWDNVKLQKNLVNDGGVETWTSATDLTNWTEYLSGTSTVNQETTTVHSGSNAVRIDVDASNSVVYISQAISVINNKYYTISGWAKVNSGTPTFYFRDTLNNGSNTDRYFTLSTTWTKLFYTTKAVGTASRNLYLIRGNATSKSLYIDDVSLIELDQLTPTTVYAGRRIKIV